MKRIVKIGLPLFLSFLIPAGILNAQENKNVQRIKIITTDKSGTKVEIDTLIKGNVSADSIKLKNGEVIYLARHGAGSTIKHVEGKNGSMYVTVTSGDKADKKMMKEITVISGDSTSVLEGGEGGDVIIVNGSKHFKEGKGGKVVTWSSSEGDSNGEKTIYINEAKRAKKNGEKTFDVKVTTDEKGNTVEKTKYVIAKDGMVVTVEGNDEAKAKALIADIEAKLGVNKEDKNMKKVVKQETKEKTKK